jgi:PAS domain S-box-containing protein
MEYKLADLVDVPKLQELMDVFHTVTAAPTAILDVDGTVLTATAWQDICTKYHRTHPDCVLRCKQSDAYIAAHLNEGSAYAMYECANGLVDVASPIMINGQHIGTVFTGQFLLKEPDVTFFRDQGRTFGFDEAGYLAALTQVPVVQQAQIQPILNYLALFTSMLADMGLQRLQQLEAQRELEESRAQFRAIADYTYDWESWVDNNGTVRWINPAVEQFTGYTVAECLAMPDYPLPLVHVDDRPVITRMHAEAVQGSCGNDVTFRLHHRDGSLRWMAISWQPVYAADGQPMGYRTSTRDFTERKRAEELTLRIGRILEDSRNELFIFDAETLHFIQVNKGGRQNLGYSMEELTRLTPVDIKPTVDAEQFATLIAPLLDGTRDLVTFETTHQRKDGSTYPVDVRLQLAREEESAVFVAIIQDITARRQADEELRVFKAVIENAPDGISFVSPEGIVTYGNAAAKQLLGYDDDFVGISVERTLAGNDIQPEAIIQQALEQGFWQGTQTGCRRDGSTLPVDLLVFPIYAADGNVRFFPGFVRDRTDLVQAEAERVMLQQQVIDAQREALRELSTPLIPISDSAVVMPLVGTIDSSRALQIMENLLEGVANHQARITIVDITGVQVVDTQVASALIQAAQAVKLLGAEVVLTGIRPDVAQTLVHLGADMSSIKTLNSLQSGIVYALQRA